MFRDASAFNQPLNDWDVSSVTDMLKMFERASAFDQPLNDWDVSSVTTMHKMFQHASAFNQPLNDWDVSSVTDINSIFAFASAFNQPLNQWDVSNVTALAQGILYAANSYSQDLSMWCFREDVYTSMQGFFPASLLVEQRPRKYGECVPAMYMLENNQNNQIVEVGSSLQPSVIVRGADYNPVAGFDVTFEVASGGGTVDPVAPVTTDTNGVAAVTSWTLGATEGLNTLTASAEGLAEVTFTATAIAGAATQLAVATLPTGGANGAVLETQPIVEIQDAQGNVVTSDSTTQVTVTISAGTGGALGGTQTVTAANGLVSFTDLSLTGLTSETYTLSFVDTSAAFPAVTSNVSLSGAGAATQLAVATLPTGGANGAVLETQPIMEIQDAQGNVVTSDSTTQVTVTISAGTGGALGGTQTVTAANGLVSFTDLSLTGFDL